MPGPTPIRDLTPAQVKTLLGASSIVLVDVREPAEFAAERIHGALNFPLSTFDPAALPRSPGQKLVFQCGTGKRSAMAIDRSRRAGLNVDSHLGGGIAAWRAAGLPTITLDAASGAVSDPR